jgi:TetR/AcrR family transcriptional regulator, regulator of cefoperazone and chloramphenicol sensitivity
MTHVPGETPGLEQAGLAPDESSLAGERNARSAIVAAATELIAQRGERATTVRAVAARAGVSASLVVHHFRTKRGLVAAVDEVVIERFSRAMTAPDDVDDPQQAMKHIAGELNVVLGEDPALRGYLRRSLLEGSEAGRRIFGALIVVTRRQLETYADRERLPSGQDLSWLAVQVLIINLAATLLSPVLIDALGRDPYDPRFMRRRTRANLRFIGNALKPYAT